MSKCSYCDRRAVWLGKGQDGDSYCHDHKRLAWNGVDLITDDYTLKGTA